MTRNKSELWVASGWCVHAMSASRVCTVSGIGVVGECSASQMLRRLSGVLQLLLLTHTVRALSVLLLDCGLIVLDWVDWTGLRRTVIRHGNYLACVLVASVTSSRDNNQSALFNHQKALVAKCLFLL